MEKDIIEILTKIAPDLYEDALQPAFKEAGRILANTISFVGIPFAGLGYLSQKTDMYFKNNLKKYAELLEKVPIDNRQEPLLEISVPIVQKFCYTSTDEIARMFNALLVGASDTRQQQNVFPSFSSIVLQLSVDEVRIIKYLKDKEAIGFCVLSKKYPNTLSEEQIRFYNLQTKIDLIFENNLEVYLFDLERMGILRSEIFATSLKLPEFEEIPFEYQFDEIINTAKFDNVTISHSNHAYYVTDFGESFIKACTYQP